LAELPGRKRRAKQSAGDRIIVGLQFFKRDGIFLIISLWREAIAEIPPFPPLKKGGGGGI
jgi:hypothetical protein